MTLARLDSEISREDALVSLQTINTLPHRYIADIFLRISFFCALCGLVTTYKALIILPMIEVDKLQ